MQPPSNDPPPPGERLDEIETRWSLLRQAHRHTVTAAGPAREQLVLRYNHAIRAYVGALVHDPHDADDLAHEIVVRLLKGDFGVADSRRGRFRDLLKVAIKNTVRTFWSRQGRQRARQTELRPGLDPVATDDEPDDRWLATWQRSVLRNADRALEDYQRQTAGNLYHTVLTLRAQYPDDESGQLAARVSAVAGRTLNAAALRQQLRRARLKFAEILIDEVARGLDDATPERVETELCDLGLMELVGDFLPDAWRTRGELVDGAPAGE